MKRFLAAVAALSLAVALAPAPAQAATPKPGATCSKAGTTADAGDKRYTCIKKGKKLVWNAGVVIVPPAPVGPTLAPGLTAAEYPGDFAGDPTWFGVRKPAVNISRIIPIEVGTLSKATSFEYTGYFIPSADSQYDFKLVASSNAFFWIGKAAEAAPTVATASISHLGTKTATEKRFSQVLVKGERYAVRIQLGAPAGKTTFEFGVKPVSEDLFEVGLQQQFKSVSPLAVSGLAAEFPSAALPSNQFPLFAASGKKVVQSTLNKVLCQAKDLTPGDSPERSGFEKSKDSLRSTGVLRAFVGYVDFTNALGTDDPITDSARFTRRYADFAASQSNGRLSVNFTVAKSYAHIDAATSRYGMQLPGRGDSQLLMEDALAAFDPTVDFSQFDVVYILTSASASEISYGNHFAKALITDDGAVTNSAFVGADWRNQEDIWRWFAQTTGHLFGLPEPGDDTAAADLAAASIWDVMSDLGTPAPSHFGWNKWVQGWLTDSEVACLDSVDNSTVLMTPASSSATGTKLVVIPISFTQEIVLESKRSNETDRFDPTADGVLLYLVDTQKPSGSGAITVLTRNKLLDLSNSPVIGTLLPGDSVQINNFAIEYLAIFEEGDFISIHPVG